MLTMDTIETTFADVCAAINYALSFGKDVPAVWVARRTLLARELGIPPSKAEDAEFDDLEYTPQHPGLTRVHAGNEWNTRVWYYDLSGCAVDDAERRFAHEAYLKLQPSAALVPTPASIVRPWWEEVQEL